MDQTLHRVWCGYSVTKTKMFLFLDCALEVHNEVNWATSQFSWDIDGFAADMKYFFKDQALCQDELMAIQDCFDLSKQKLIMHSNARFLTLQSFCNRILELKAVLVGYFVHFPSKKIQQEIATKRSIPLPENYVFWLENIGKFACPEWGPPNFHQNSRVSAKGWPYRTSIFSKNHIDDVHSLFPFPFAIRLREDKRFLKFDEKMSNRENHTFDVDDRTSSFLN